MASNGEPKSWSVWFPAALGLIGVVLGGLIGLAATAYSTNQALSAQIRQQQAEFDEAHKETQRKLRSQAYVRFLQALEAYSEQYSPLTECAEIPAPQRKKYAVCLSYGASEPALWLRLRAALDQVFLYGSDTSIQAAKLYIGQLATDRSLRRTLETRRKRVQQLWKQRKRFARQAMKTREDGFTLNHLSISLDLAQGTLHDFIQKNSAKLKKTPDFAAYRTRFQLIMCSELNTLPRGECK